MPEQDSRRKRKRILLWAAALLALAGVIAVVVCVFLLPYRDAESHMRPDSGMTLQHREDGSIELSWPEAQKADFYRVEVLHQVEVENKKGEMELQWQTLHTADVDDGTSCVLPQLPWDEILTLRVNTMVRYPFPGEDKVRPGDTPLEETLRLQPPEVEELSWKPDPDQDSVTLTFRVGPGEQARLFWCDAEGQWQLLKTLDGSDATVTFGEQGDVPMLEHGQVCRLRLDCLRKGNHSVYYSSPSEEVNVIREDLLDRNLRLLLVDMGENICTLTWNETKGEFYEVQMRQTNGGEWVTIHTVGQAEERMFTTGHLKAYRSYSFRVVAIGGQALANGTAAVSSDVEIVTQELVLYSTIWPIKELEVFSSPDLSDPIGKVKGGTTLCVAEVCDGAFGIRYADGVMGYIDSNYCMIDLVDYLGELCSYDITNSYSSIYKIHNYNMPRITGTVIVGYEDVRLADGSYLVPLLYPVAQRLLVAAEAARDAGYRLKIYDSYRPNRATAFLYNQAESLLEQPVPGNIQDPTEEDPDRLLTYGKVMTDETYPLTYFLAQGASLHNLGIAVDLTIEKIDSGEEQPMQSRMHDLSYFSMLYRNNDNAKLLQQFMEGAGFAGLISEWWHFQDDQIRKELTLPALWGGVTAEGWKLDDYGWRYRSSDGTYASGCTLTIGETEYTFDEHGYVTENG